MKDDPTIQVFQRVQLALVDCAAKLAVALQPFVVALSDYVHAVHKEFWQAYLEAGAPYGETDEGLTQWLEEIALVVRSAREAEKILQRQERSAKARKLAKDKK